VVVPPAAQSTELHAPLADPRATVPASAVASSAAAATAATAVPAPDLRSSVQQVMTAPASPENAAIMRGNFQGTHRIQEGVSQSPDSR
jgi:hypothetical protein